MTGLQAALDAKLDDSQATAFGLSLLDDADAAAGRSTLGLGTAAVKNSGTSGDAVALLNGANSWSGAQTLTAGAAGTGMIVLSLTPTDFGAGKPRLLFERAPANGCRISLHDGAYAGSLHFRATDYAFQSGSATVASISSAGINLASGKVLQVAGTQVVGARGPAIADDASGAANQATINAILSALRTHGLIAP